jgi:SpoVK/Ycf46/Vps4 family AAA+-type ATPase
MAEALARGLDLPAVRLAHCLRLGGVETRTLILLAACELFSEFRELCARLPVRPSGNGPSARLLHALFAPDDIGLPEFVSQLWASPLLELDLIRPASGPGDGTILRLENRVLRHLLGDDRIDSASSAYLRVEATADSPDEVSTVDLARNVRTGWWPLASRLLDPPGEFRCGLLIALVGPDPVLKRRTAAAIARHLEKPLLVLDLDAAANADLGTVAEVVMREALLREAGLLIEQWDAVALDRLRHELFRRELLRSLERRSGLVMLSLGKTPTMTTVPWRKATVTLEVPGLDIRRREALWEAHLTAWEGPRDPVDVGELAAKFRLEEGQIVHAAQLARYRVASRFGDENRLTIDDLHAACRAVSQSRLAEHATRVEPFYRWSDLVLPVESRAQLTEIVQRVRTSVTVLGQWEFDRKLANRRGTAALFVGPPGTGKSMAARIVAGALGLDLFRIDLSSVVSKYVGETEKRLAAVFEEAESSNAILFFDEADALFGKRAEVHDAQDRFANIEISYLLQRMEDYGGVAILASNRKSDIDEAFTRRLDFVVLFPEPGEDERKEIWTGMFPAAAPLAPDLDLDFMAQRFRLTGGSIRNIALSAAFLAAAEGEPIGMRHVVRATRREHQKAGKVCNEHDFGPYFRLLEDAR